MIGRIALLIALVVLPLTVSADMPTARQLGEGEILRGQFEQERHLEGFSAPLSSRGSFVLAPGSGLIWRTETPFPIVTVITAAGLVQEMNGEETLRLDGAKLPIIARLYDMLSAALVGDWSKLEGGFDVTNDAEGEGWRVMLSPHRTGDPGMPFESIELFGRELVEQIVLTKAGGDFDRLVFRDQTVTEGPLNASEAAAFDFVAQ